VRLIVATLGVGFAFSTIARSQISDIAPQMVPILIFIAVAAAVAMKRYRQTLD
jgi:hypothetical protein